MNGKYASVYQVPDGVSMLTLCTECHDEIGSTQDCENCRTYRMLLVGQANGRRLEVVDDPAEEIGGV